MNPKVCAMVVATVLMVQCALGDYEIRVQFHTYSNPTSGCQDCTISTGDVTCCDAALNLLTCRDDDQCDNIFIVCLRELGLSGNVGAESLCTTAPRITETLPDSDNIDFGSEELANFTSTVLFQEAGSWEGVQMYIAVLDDDGVPGQSLTDSLVDRFVINLNGSIRPATNYTEETIYNGFFGFGQLQLSFQLSCTETFSGSDCATECSSTMLCDEDGNRVCQPGRTGANCENIDDCLENVACVPNGQCVDGDNAFTCECNAGFTGADCMADIDDCEEVDCGNGTCLDTGANTFTCECDAGFTGDRCNIVRDTSITTTAILGGVLGTLLIFALITIVALISAIVALVKRKPKQKENAVLEMTVSAGDGNKCKHYVHGNTSGSDHDLPAEYEVVHQHNTQDDTGSYVDVTVYNRASRIEDQATYDYIP